MKVKQLIAELQKYNPENEVINYVQEAEEYGKTTTLKAVTNQSEMPYAKGDKPEIDGETVLIMGWIA